MKNKNASFVIIALALMLTATTCKKEKNPHTTVNGTVLEYGTNSPIVGATVFIERADKDAFLSQAYHTYTATKTNANGDYSFKFDYEDEYKYLVTATDTIHFQSEHYTIKMGENSLNIVQYAPGYLKLHVKNTTPFDQTDEIYINGSHASSGGTHIYGYSVDTLLVFINYGGRNNTLVWAITKNSTTSNYNQSIFYPVLDTTNYNINY